MALQLRKKSLSDGSENPLIPLHIKLIEFGYILSLIAIVVGLHCIRIYTNSARRDYSASETHLIRKNRRWQMLKSQMMMKTMGSSKFQG